MVVGILIKGSGKFGFTLFAYSGWQTKKSSQQSREDFMFV